MSNSRTAHSTSTQPQSIVTSDADDKKFELLKLQLDYVWKWFQFHATQRTTMFNYFLVVTGIVATAYVSLLKEGYNLLSFAVGILGLLTSVGFIYLDCRNRELVHLAERIMEKIEGETLFPDMKTKQGNEEIQLGILYRELLEDSQQREKLSEMLGGFTGNALRMPMDIRRLQFRLLQRKTVFRHTFWFRKIQIAIAIIFAFLAIRALGATSGYLPVKSEATETQKKIDTLTGMVKDMNTTNQALQQQIGDLKAQLL